MQLPLWNTGETDPPWSQRPDEGPDSYARFQAYLHLEDGRSVRRAWMRVTGSAGGVPPAAWYEASKLHEWKARAAEYDKAGNEQDIRKSRKAQLENRQDRIGALSHTLSKLLLASQQLDPLAGLRAEMIEELKQLQPLSQDWEDKLKAINKLMASPSTPKLGEVTTGIKGIVGELRTEYGDDPKYRTDLKPNDNIMQPLHITLKGVSTDDL